MKKYLLLLLLLVIVGLGVGYFLYNKPHKNIAKTPADFELEAPALFQEFETDETAANAKYLDKVVEVKGRVKETSVNEEGVVSVTLDAGADLFGVICQLDNLSEHKRLEFSEGETLTFRGVCTGMLMDVVLVRCVEAR